MADYIYLLENRLSAAQKQALVSLREVARAKGVTLFLVGGAVRDLTSGSPVRDLDVAVQGNVLKLRKDLEAAGAVVSGSHDVAQALYLSFPGGVRVEVGSTMCATYPKPGKPVLKPGTILEDLRRRDFTANAMALSLNEGSYGLLMDPLNGVADIENRELRLVSNYGFIEEPVRMIRAVRFAARLGWTLEEKTQARYATGKEEGYISGLQEFHRGYEAEEIVHEEDPLRVMRRLEAEGWMQVVAPSWNSAKANVVELEKVRESETQLQLQGIHPDAAAVNFPLLTAKMAAKDVEALRKTFPRQGFVAEIEALEGQAKEFAGQLGSRGMGSASASYRLIQSAKPEAVLQVVYTTKSGALQAKFKSFFGEWPQVRQKIPLALMVEMRITPEIAGYQELVEKLFFELMDGRLGTVEEMRAFLEPYSPPAPPPPVHLRRARAARKDAKKGRAKKEAALAAEDGEDGGDDEELEDAAADPDEEEDGEDEVESLGARAAFQVDLGRDPEVADADAGDEDIVAEEAAAKDVAAEDLADADGDDEEEEDAAEDVPPVKPSFRKAGKVAALAKRAAVGTSSGGGKGDGKAADAAEARLPVKAEGGHAKAPATVVATPAKSALSKKVEAAPRGSGVKAAAVKVVAKAAVKAVPAKVVKEQAEKRAASGKVSVVVAPPVPAKGSKTAAKRVR